MTSQPVRFAFVGKGGTGKTTLAEFCEEEYGCHKISLARELRKVASIKENHPEKEWNGALYRAAYALLEGAGLKHSERVQKAHKISSLWAVDLRDATDYRNLLQRMGTDSARTVDPMIWARVARRDIKNAGPEAPLVLDDVRFLNESEMLWGEGFVLVRIEVPYEIRRERIKKRDGLLATTSGSWTSHISETEQDFIKVDYTLDNSDPDGGEVARNQVRLLAGQRFGKRDSAPQPNTIPLVHHIPATTKTTPMIEHFLAQLATMDLKSAHYEVEDNEDGTWNHTFSFTEREQK